MKVALVLLAVISMASVMVGCKAKVDSDGASVQVKSPN
jgi:hypothetical protein